MPVTDPPTLTIPIHLDPSVFADQLRELAQSLIASADRIDGTHRRVTWSDGALQRSLDAMAGWRTCLEVQPSVQLVRGQIQSLDPAIDALRAALGTSD